MRFNYLAYLMVLACSLGLQAAEPDIDICSSAELSVPFPDSLVTQALDKFKIPKNEWSGIIGDLAYKQTKVEALMKERAAKMNPNPYGPPPKPVTLSKLYRDIIYEMFTTTLNQFDVNDPALVDEMFNNILEWKADREWECYQRQQRAGK